MSRQNFSLKKLGLSEALEARDEKLVRELLADGQLNVNEQLLNGTTPLIQAIQQGKNDMVKLLIELGANVRTPHTVKKGPTLWTGGLGNNMRQVYPLQAAVEAKNGFAIQVLLSEKAPLEHCTSDLPGLFELAIRMECENLVKLLFLMGKQREQDGGLLHSIVNLTNALLVAVRLQKQNMARLLLDLGADVNREADGMLPLVAAANNQDWTMCQLLLANGATLGRVEGSLANSITPLTLATRAGLLKAVTTLLELGQCNNGLAHRFNNSLNLSLTDTHCLLYAAAKNNLAIGKKLIAAGCPVNCEDPSGNTPLHILCMTNNRSDDTSFLEYLLQFRTFGNDLKSSDIVNVDARNGKGLTPLMVAVTSRNVDSALLLLQAGADVELRDKEQLTALHHAVQRASDVLVLALLRCGCSVDAYKKNIPTPLHEAVRINDFTVVDILLEFKADVNLMTLSKETPLHLAVQSRGEELVELFLQLGLDQNAKTRTGDTPLMIAARQDSAAICELLVTNGANMDYRDLNQQETALILSVYFGFEENAKVLIAHGAGLDIPDKRNTTALYWSIFNARIECLIFLILAGAKLTKQMIDRTPCNLTVRKNKFLSKWMEDMVTNVRPLQDLCRLTIRANLRKTNPGLDVLQRVNGLSLPTKLKDYLGYRTDELDSALAHVTQEHRNMDQEIQLSD